MFMTRIAIRPPASLSALALAALTGGVVGACFVGSDAAGLPCTSDAQCGTELTCIDGLCGGSFDCGDDESLSAEEVCDGINDCPDGSDEDYELCYGEGERFECGDGVEIPDEWVCNENEDCVDGSDELDCGEDETADETDETDTTDETTETTGTEEGPNLCEGEPGIDFEYFDGPLDTGVPSPLGVIVEQLAGDGAPDALLAGEDGTVVKIFQYGADMGQIELSGESEDAPYYGARQVVDVEIADLDGDASLDIIVAAYDSNIEGTAVYIHTNEAPDDPAAYGGAFYSLDVSLGALEGIEVGEFEGNSWPDLATIYLGDGALEGTATLSLYSGDPGNVSMVTSYFGAAGFSETIALNEFHDSELIDIDDDGVSELIVSGLDGSDAIIYVMGVEDSAWVTHELLFPMAPADSIAVGNIDADSFDDFAILSSSGALQTYGNMMGNGFSMGPQMPTLGGGTSGLSLSDLNCDGNTDFAFAVQDPGQIKVLLGDGMGTADLEAPLALDVDGEPQGWVGIDRLEIEDETQDFFYATGGSRPEMRILSTSMMMMMP